MSIDASLIFRQQVSSVPGQRTPAFEASHSRYMINLPGPQTAKHTDPHIITVPNPLQNTAVVHNLSRNTPAMPMVASAATHKLSGFFMPGSFSA
jgi:hypothetical protein